MKCLLVAIVLFITQSAYSQQGIEGNWYLVTKNNLRQIKITQDSIFQHTTGAFAVEQNVEFEPRNSYRIIDKIMRDDTSFYYLETDEEDTLIMTFWFDEKAKPSRLFQGFSGDFNLHQIPPFTLVSEEEIASYDQLTDLLEMKEDDFLDFASFMEELMKHRAEYGRHHLSSMMKYKLVDLGYDPRFKLSQLDEKLNKFASSPATKEVYDSIFNMK